MPYLLGLGLTLGLFALYVASRPSAFRIARSLTIDAPASTLFALINDFHAWTAWSPWDKVDPNLERIYEGADAGVGAVYKWRGPKTGEGSMTLVESVENAKVEIDLRFIKPFPANNHTVFTLEAEGSATKVTWAMTGNNSFVSKAFNVIMNVDKMVGGDFEKGLAAMRAAASKG
jgi:Polyketide cyclase / dehydrase and lipid transport